MRPRRSLLFSGRPPALVLSRPEKEAEWNVGSDSGAARRRRIFEKKKKKEMLCCAR